MVPLLNTTVNKRKLFENEITLYFSQNVLSLEFRILLQDHISLFEVFTFIMSMITLLLILATNQ